MLAVTMRLMGNESEAALCVTVSTYRHEFNARGRHVGQAAFRSDQAAFSVSSVHVGCFCSKYVAQHPRCTHRHTGQHCNIRDSSSCVRYAGRQSMTAVQADKQAHLSALPSSISLISSLMAIMALQKRSSSAYITKGATSAFRCATDLKHVDTGLQINTAVRMSEHEESSAIADSMLP